MNQYGRGELHFITSPSLFQSLYYKFMQTTQFPKQRDSAPEGADLNPARLRSAAKYTKTEVMCSQLLVLLHA